MQPSVLPQPTTPAMVSSFMQFCNETTIAVRREILPDHHRRPRGVVGFHADEGDVDRLLLGELLGVGDMQRAHRHGELRHVMAWVTRRPCLLHVLDMLGPGIDEGDVLARLHHMRPGIAADGARSHDDDLVAHDVLPNFIFVGQT